MKNKINHLEDHTMTYWEHWKHGMKLSVRLSKMVFKSTVHAFFPNTFAEDGPIEVYNIYNEIKDLPNVERLYKNLSASNR